MTGIDWLVFSRDRPCQLDALLRSLERHAGEPTRTVSVLYHSSSPGFDAGYALTRSAWPWAWHVPEIDFSEQVRRWLLQATDVVGFLCDDDLFYRPAPVLRELPLPFSYRLGFNCTRQHPTGREQRLPEIRDAVSDLLSWEWLGAEGDFGYPFSLDGHAYAREAIIGLVHDVDFVDPTTLEAGVVSALLDPSFNRTRERFGSTYHAPARSCLVSIPANRVTMSSHNPIMADGLSVVELNALFLRHQRIDLDAMDFSNVDGAHSEVPYVLSY